MRIIELKNIWVEKNLINYDYSIPNGLLHFFDQKEKFYIEYPSEYDFSSVPYSVLAIPFVMNLLPLAWLSDSIIMVEELDESFFRSIENIKQGFCRIHPAKIFGGDVQYGRLVNNDYIPREESCVLFSGGVDALSAVINHIDKNPVLINVWGGDIRTDNVQGHAAMETELKKMAESMQLNYFYIKSSLRYFYIESELEQVYGGTLRDTWWHCMQHSIGMLSLLAPYDYLRQCRYNIIASSYTPDSYIDHETGRIIPCSNYPFIDERLANVSAQVIHDGFDLKRIEKIRDIITYLRAKKISMPLKVCFYPNAGNNCSHCEKCYRTMLAIYALGEDPSDFGFEFNKKVLRRIKRFMSINILGDNTKTFWVEISNYVKANNNGSQYKWLIDYKYNTGNRLYKKIYKKGRGFVGFLVKKIRRGKDVS